MHTVFSAHATGRTERQVEKGRGAVTNPAGPLRGHARSRPRTTAGAASTNRRRRAETVLVADVPKHAITTQPVAGRSVRPVGKPVPGVRARLHLLLRAALAFLLEPGSRARFRDAHLPQARARAAARPGTLVAGLRLQAASISARNTDPYQPAEREHRTTRELLEVLLAHRHPVTIVTKGALVLRDLDLLARLADLHLVTVFVSLTTLDDGAEAHARATRGVARGAAARGPRACGRRRAGGRAAGADDSRAERPRDGAPARRGCREPGRRRAAFMLLRLPSRARRDCSSTGCASTTRRARTAC